MSRFYASISGQSQTSATRRGSEKSGIEGHIRGWHIGIRVNGYVNKDGKNCFDIYQTGGSSQSTSEKLIAEIVEGEK